MERPAGVTATAIVTFSAAAYLWVLGLIMLVRPGLISMTNGAPLLHGLELAGPYMFLLVAAVPAALLFLTVFFAGHWAIGLAVIPLASLSASFALLVEAAIGIFWLGRLFDKFDASGCR